LRKIGEGRWVEEVEMRKLSGVKEGARWVLAVKVNKRVAK
jgi:hypothetical protein